MRPHESASKALPMLLEAAEPITERHARRSLRFRSTADRALCMTLAEQIATLERRCSDMDDRFNALISNGTQALLQADQLLFNLRILSAKLGA